MAYDFNGSNQYLSIGSAPATALPITMACWFNSDSTTVNQRLVGLYESGSSYVDLGIRGADAGDPVAAVANTNGTVQIVGTTAGYSANTWHHACGVFTSTTSRTAYIDGGNSATGTNTIAQVGNISTTRIGNFFTDIQYMDGRIAEVGIWNVALTQPEIASLARGMTCEKVRPQSLVFYTPLVRDLIDYKGGLTINNINSVAAQGTHPRVYA
jgi:hypothetical protein